MSYEYSDPTRAADLHALPDVEIFQAPVWEVDCSCGTYEVTSAICQNDKWTECPSCGEVDRPIIRENARLAWWYQFGMPGYMPDGDVMGPYPTEAEALAAAREGVE